MNCNMIISHVRTKAAAKTATLQDYVIQAIATAIRHAESPGEANYLATKYILKLASPLKRKNKIVFNANNDPYYKVRNILKGLAAESRWFGPSAVAPTGYWNHYYSWRDTDLEAADIRDIRSIAKHLVDMFERHYVYIFVRQDICIEQQVVQAAHATFVAGASIVQDVIGNAQRPGKFDPNYTHFVLIGVPDLPALLDAYDHVGEVLVGHRHAFYEGDMDNEMTAFTSHIITQPDRHHFKQYNLLKMPRI